MTIARVLAIAGSDSGGGAGIQADIKTITMLGGHAMTAVTAITAQNTMGVIAVHALPAEMVIAQMDAVATDIGVDAIKIGMIGSAKVARAVAERLNPTLPRHRGASPIPVVFDPVMVATSGARLADAETIDAFETLMRRATLVTPNVPELEILTGLKIVDEEGLLDAAFKLGSRIGTAVLAKGGHLRGEKVFDALFPGGPFRRGWTPSNPRIHTRHNHGTGCTLSSAIATGLAQGMTLRSAIARARAYVRATLLVAPGLGAGHGPMGHGLGRSWDERAPPDPQPSPRA